MPRHPNHKTTNVYWLFDMRPETVAIDPHGVPFYCGKTVHSVTERLSDHRYAAGKFPGRKLSKLLSECGDDIRVQIVEIVPVGDDWAERERRWISTLRLLHPDGCVNISSGGDGPAGYIPTPETRARISAKMTGKKMPEGHGEKIAAKTRGQKRTPETRARMSAARKGEVRTQDQKDKISATLTGYKHPPEFGEKISRANKGRIITEEHRAKISAGHMGKILSDDHKRKLSEAKIGKPRSVEAAAKSGAWHKGKPKSVEQRAKMSAAQKGRPLSAEHCEALRIGQQQRRARERAAEHFLPFPY